MKKFLSLIGVLTIFSASTGTIVGCTNNNSSSQKKDFQLSEILKGYVAPNLFLLFTSQGKPYNNQYPEYIIEELRLSMANYINSYLEEHGSSGTIKDTDLRLSYLNEGQTQSSLLDYLYNLTFAADEFHKTIAIQVQKADAVALPWLSSDGAVYKTSFLLDRQFRISQLFTVGNPLNLTTNYDSTKLPWNESAVKNKVIKAAYSDFRTNSLKAIAAQIDPKQTTLPSEYQEYRSGLSSNNVEKYLTIEFGSKTFPTKATDLETFLNEGLSITASSVEIGGQDIPDVLFPIVGQLKNTPTQTLVKTQIGTNALNLAGFKPATIMLSDISPHNGRIDSKDQAKVFTEMNTALSVQLIDEWKKEFPTPKPTPKIISIISGTDFFVPGFPFLIGGSTPVSAYQKLTLASIVTSLYLYGEGNPSADTFKIEFTKK